MSTSLTREVTIFPNAAPMMTPTARSTTFPFIANSLNSLNIGSSRLGPANGVGDQKQDQSGGEPEQLQRQDEPSPPHPRDPREVERRHEVPRRRRQDVREPVAELVREHARLARDADEVGER